MNLDFLVQEQEFLSKRVFILNDNIRFNNDDLLFGVDIQYKGDKAYCAISVHYINGQHYKTFVYKTVTEMEYIPGLFCFREGPPILKGIHKIMSTYQIKPKLLVIDGHGIAHPRKLGVATWIGVKTNIPSLGIAKRPLLDYEGEPDNYRGASLPIYYRNEQVGNMLRIQKDVKPVFVSPGFQISHHQSLEITLDISPEFRICNPIRRADQAARQFCKGHLHEKTINIT